MFETYRQEMMWGGRKLSLETGKVARQADGAVVVQYGGTTVLCTIVAVPQAREDMDFLPFSVHYQEKAFAVGRIPGGFFKREGKPSEKEVLTSRLIDRPLRPLFPEGFFNEVQVICTVLSHDLENNPDIPALIGASTALTLSGVPFLGPVGAVRVGYADGKYVLNPSSKEVAQGQLDLVVAGTAQGVLMVESEAHELSEEVMLGAVTFGHEAFQPVIDMIIRLAEHAAKDPWDFKQAPEEAVVKGKLSALVGSELSKAYQEKSKTARSSLVSGLKSKALEALGAEGYAAVLVARIFKQLAQDIVRKTILETQGRIDGRNLVTIRPIVCEASVLPQTHGSALFTRGDTQAFVVATLGTGEDSQIIDALEGEYREPFLLHYNFPPYSVGEAGKFVGPGRREIGHGKLAWRALHPLLPTQADFPYTLRVVSEITESDGSSSMATVCGSSLALMDAGVPLKRPVAGIAMGLIKEGEQFAVLSDILGDEDSLGDMDFKVAGTREGITALQMDIKITSITTAIMEKALHQAKEGRFHILTEMAKALEAPREILKDTAPRIVSIKIHKDKIREIIGPGGKVIRDICETTGAKIDIEDDGTVKVFAQHKESLESALARIRSITHEPQVGEIYEGKVVKIMDFGAFVNFSGNQDGLVHISELAPRRVEKVRDVVQEGEQVRVKIIGFDRGKIKLSIKQALDQPVSGPAASGG
ncbi:MAG: polyribonucleotide nucleotidyltransferase [Alphaproteobacteria bacterium]